LILTVGTTPPTDRQQLKSPWLLVRILGAVVTMAIWPTLQLLSYEVPLRHLFRQEVVDWLGPEHLGAQPYLEIPYRLIVTSACGLFIFAAPFVILFWKKGEFGNAAREISIVCLALISVEILFNFPLLLYIQPIIQ